MKCSVPGCDTDEHIVSYTSVFFVNFPEDPVVQNQWITLFGITDAKLIHGLLAGEHKVCSCHFAEDCFGRHPVYGYRYLLPGAVPAVIPQQQMAEFLPESFRLPEDDEDNYYFIYESEAPTPDPQVPLGEVKSEPDFEATSEPNYQSGEEEGLEEIGIKYLDGKYYFFQLNADPADEAAGTPDPTDEAMGEPDPVTAGQAPDDVVSLPEGGEYHGVDAAEKHLDESTCDTAENAALDEELHSVADFCRPDGELLRVDSLKVELSEEEFLESVDDEKEMKLVDDYADTERLDDDDGEEVVKVEKVSEILLTGATIVDPSQTECDEDNFDTEYIDDAESESLEHGSIEALDEVSAFNGKAPGRSRNVKTQGHVCSECGKSFAYPSGLAKHVLTHTKAKPYSCELCDRSFSQKINLKVHMRRHTGERPIPRFSCEVCGKKCQRRSELRVHVAIHEKQYPIACPACESRFAHVTTLYTHLRQDHSDREITMEQVVEKFAESSDPKIIDDKQYVSEGETVGPDGRWECSVCQQRFTYVKMLRRHKRKLHPKIFCCKYCQRTFPYRSMLEKHMTVHTLEKRFGCEHCSAMFSQRSNLNKHVQIKHSHVIRLVEPVDEEAELVEESVDGKAAPYHCLRCNKSFYRQATWLAHLDTHQTDNGHVQPECEVCNMTFASRMSLKTHTRRMHRTLERFLPSFSAKQLPLGGFDALQEYEERAGKEDAGQVEDFFSED